MQPSLIDQFGCGAAVGGDIMRVVHLGEGATTEQLPNPLLVEGEATDDGAGAALDGRPFEILKLSGHRSDWRFLRLTFEEEIEQGGMPPSQIRATLQHDLR